MGLRRGEAFPMERAWKRPHQSRHTGIALAALVVRGLNMRVASSGLTATSTWTLANAVSFDQASSSPVTSVSTVSQFSRRVESEVNVIRRMASKHLASTC